MINRDSRVVAARAGEPGWRRICFTIVASAWFVWGVSRAVGVETHPSPVGQWGRAGSLPGEFDVVYGVAVDGSGNVYVADHDNKRIQKFDSAGSPVGDPWDAGGAPWDVTVAPDGNIYVTDYYRSDLSNRNGYLKKFSPEGVLLASWDGFFTASGLAVDSSGVAYVLEHAYDRVQRFDTTTGTFLGSWSTGYMAYGLELDPSQQYLYIPAYLGHYVQKWTKDAGTPVGDHLLNTPGAAEHVAVDAAGDIYVSSHEYYVRKYSSVNGEWLASFGKEEWGDGDGQFKRATGIGISPLTGHVYVADEGNNRIQEFVPEPGSLSLLALGSAALMRRRRR